MEKLKKRKKFIIPLGILLVVIILAIIAKYSGLLNSLPKGAAVYTSTVETMDLIESIAVKGSIEGIKKAELYGTPGYQIKEILVKEEDQVKADQPLMKLVAGPGISTGSDAARESARLEYIAGESLYREGAISRSEYLRLKGAYEAALEMSGSSTLESPFEGIITRVNGVPGALITAESPVLVIEDLSDFQMKVKINEYDIAKIKIGQRVIISSDVLGKEKLEGRVVHISPSGEKKDPLSSEMVIPVTISIDKKDVYLISGITARGEIVLNEAKGVLVVPIDSIVEDYESGETFVFLLKENKLEKVQVVLGVEGTVNVEVESGDIKDGDEVIVNPDPTLADGQEAYDLEKLISKKK